MDTDNHDSGSPTDPETRSIQSGIAFELAIWVGEVFVGLAPLVSHLFLLRFMAVPLHVARCRDEIGGQFQDCHWVADGLEAEICILSVVLSGLALVPMSRPRAGALTAWRFLARFIAAIGAGSIMVASAMTFVLVTAGINQDTSRVVWWLLAGAVLGSWIMAMDRASARH